MTQYVFHLNFLKVDYLYKLYHVHVEECDYILYNGEFFAYIDVLCVEALFRKNKGMYFDSLFKNVIKYRYRTCR